MPLVSKTFSQIITFTRASTATYFDATGTLQSAAIDVPRFDYDPATLAARGFLIEEQRTNDFTNSNDFSNAWGVVGTSLTVTADTTTSPDGTVNADSVIESAATEIHYAVKDFSITGNATYSLSVFVKNLSGTRFLGLRISNTTWTNRITAVFDPSTGTWASAPSNIGTATGATGTIQNVGNGWYRVTITGLPDPAVATVRATIAISNNSANSLPLYAGDGTSGFYLWGAQFETGGFSTSYIPTTTTALTRSADEASVNTLSPWYNATEGTLFADFQNFAPPSGTTVGRRAAEISSGSTADRIAIGYGLSANENFGFVSSATVAQFNLDTPGTPSAKVALAYKNADFALCANGTSVLPQASGSVPSGMTKMDIGNGVDLAAARTANGHIRRITYYPRRLSNAELQGITA